MQRLRSTLSFVVPPVLVAIGVFGLWYVAHYFLLDEWSRFKLPTPDKVITDGFGNEKVIDNLLRGFVITARLSLIGLLVAIAIGVLAAILMSQSKVIERKLFPYAVVMQTLPLFALVPLFGIWWGFGLFSQTVICVLIGLFPIITNTLFGLQSTDSQQHDLFTLRGASRWTRLVKLQIPASLPAMFTGFRIAAGLSVIGAVVGDFFFRRGDPEKAGLGRLISLYNTRPVVDSPKLIAALLLSCTLGIIYFAGVSWLRGRLTSHWYVEDERKKA